MTSDTDTVAKIAALPDILEAAVLLHKTGVLEHDPAFYIKRYIDLNPDINQILNSKNDHSVGK